MTPLDKEARTLKDPLAFGNRITKLAWNWMLEPWQGDVLRSVDRYLLLLCSRQSGKSSVLMVKAVWKALTTANALILIVAEQRQSNEDVRKARELVKVYNEHLAQRYGGKLVINILTDNKTSIEFANGSRIIALPANEKVRGYSAPDMVIIDEAAYLADEVFTALDPMLTVSEGQLILASTPNGTNGFFYHEYLSPRYRKILIPWQSSRHLLAKQEEIRAKRLHIGEAYVKQEYEIQFIDDVSALFTERALRESLEPDEEVFTEQMANINKVLMGEVELI